MVWQCAMCGPGVDEGETAADDDDAAGDDGQRNLGELELRRVGETLEEEGGDVGQLVPVPHTVHGISSAPRGRCTVWACTTFTTCGAGSYLDGLLARPWR